MSNLTILTVVENDMGLIDLMIKSVYRFSTIKPYIIICDNGRNKNILDKYKKNNDILIVKNIPELPGGSNRHSSGLNKIFPLVKTQKTAIIESDCIVLKHGWDDCVLPYDFVAAEKIPNIYHICFLAFNTEILKGVDFRPGTSNNRANRNYGVDEDVGWQIKTRISSKIIKKMEFVDCKTGKGKLFNNTFQSDEFWLDDIPILAHFGRGSNLVGKTWRRGFKSISQQLNEWKTLAEKIVG